MKNYIKSSFIITGLLMVFIITCSYTYHYSIKIKNTIDLEKNQTPPITKGEMLIAKSDCGGCHKPNVKLLGPSYLEIAKKYTVKDINYLANKIVKGGSGVFGKIPMTAHPNIKSEDAKEMAKYILSVK